MRPLIKCLIVVGLNENRSHPVTAGCRRRTVAQIAGLWLTLRSNMMVSRPVFYGCLSFEVWMCQTCPSIETLSKNTIQPFQRKGLEWIKRPNWQENLFDLVLEWLCHSSQQDRDPPPVPRDTNTTSLTSAIDRFNISIKLTNKCKSESAKGFQMNRKYRSFYLFNADLRSAHTQLQLRCPVAVTFNLNTFKFFLMAIYGLL